MHYLANFVFCIGLASRLYSLCSVLIKYFDILSICNFTVLCRLIKKVDDIISNKHDNVHYLDMTLFGSSAVHVWA